jgi:hypothetical protein
MRRLPGPHHRPFAFCVQRSGSHALRIPGTVVVKLSVRPLTYGWYNPTLGHRMGMRHHRQAESTPQGRDARFQLKFSWEQIIQAGAPTLDQTYSNLTGRNDGWATFKALIDEKFPPGRPSGVTTDNPFPL